MRILVVGGGGREHAMLRALATARPRPELLVAPGNGGTGALAESFPVAVDDVPGLVGLAQAQHVDCVIVGPEVPLVLGLADALRAAGVPCVGPSRAAARLEGSKAFCREVAARAAVPGPRFAVVTHADEVESAVRSFAAPPVVKAAGLAAGKGVYLPLSHVECAATARELLAGSLGDAGKTVVLEERLVGTEASIFFACDGKTALALPHAQDHKRVGDGDTGPNTGGMGAVSPNPLVTDAVVAEVRAKMVDPVLALLEAEGAPFVGFLFVGVMLTGRGPQLLEYNVRLGDPETEAVLPRLEDGEFQRLCVAMTQQRLSELTLVVDPRPTCAIVLAAHGYPDAPRKGDAITVDAALATPDRWLDHAGTKLDVDVLRTSGGRVAVVVARGGDAVAARALAYEGAALVCFDGMHYRRDIGGGPA